MFDFTFENCWYAVIFLFVGLYLLVNFIVDNFTIPSGSGKRILITGCDSGFGYDTALKLNECNCKVFAGCLTQYGVNRLQNDNSFGGIAFIMDVTKDEDVKRAKKLIEDNGDLDGLVNNAGIVNVGFLEWRSIDEMKKVMEVNYWGTVRTTKAMLPLLKKSHGRVVNVTSIGGRFSGPYASSYFSSKFATEAFSDCLRLEMKPWGVSVHIIEPTLHKNAIVPSKAQSLRTWQELYTAQPPDIKDEFSEESFEEYVERSYGALSFTKTNDGVINNIKHALLSYIPRRRYVSGQFGTILVIFTHLPTVVQDLVSNLFMPLLSPKHCKKNKTD